MAPDADVRRDDEGTFHANGADGKISVDDSLVPLVLAAIDSPTNGRT
ncbi:hypothetical protein [Halocatena marina]|uniref:Uncharacterized protein n=1 Tax=Halocatena marina TaxID=2934937 RepID=A0ABD5YUJ8_9EURY|nr:hypothetical protein [Halocatena marina]